MNNILILGAGRSSSSLINYVLRQGRTLGWSVTVGDYSEKMAVERIGNSNYGTAIRFDIRDDSLAREVIAGCDLVISLLPAHLHIEVARYCLEAGRHLLNASYVTPEMSSCHEDAKAKGLLFLNECGLDPGIDHMSAMQVIDRIRSDYGKVTSFESFTGGLIAPGTDPDNPWRYKFTWNPRNVVMAGQGTAKYLQGGQFKYIPYQQLFQRVTNVSVAGYGEYEGYANRDSLKYLDTYGLSGIRTMLRGTLRNTGFCAAWNILVQLGCCDDQYTMENVGEMTHRNFINSFLEFHNDRTVEEKIAFMFTLDPHGEEMKRLKWSGLFTKEPVGLSQGTPAQILEHILKKKWTLAPGDQDFIVMWHRFIYEHNGKRKEIQAHLAVKGENENDTAMAKTVGLPLGIAAKLLAEGKIKSRGVRIPVASEIYEPVLNELRTLGIYVRENEREI